MFNFKLIINLSENITTIINNYSRTCNGIRLKGEILVSCEEEGKNQNHPIASQRIFNGEISQKTGSIFIEFGEENTNCYIFKEVMFDNDTEIEVNFP